MENGSFNIIIFGNARHNNNNNSNIASCDLASNVRRVIDFVQSVVQYDPQHMRHAQRLPRCARWVDSGICTTNNPNVFVGYTLILKGTFLTITAVENRTVCLASQTDDEEPGVDVEGDDDDGANSVEQDPNERPRKIRR